MPAIRYPGRLIQRKETRRMADERDVGNRVKDGIIGVIRGTGEVAQAAIETVSETAQAAVRATGATGGAGAGVGARAREGGLAAVGAGSGGARPGLGRRWAP